MDLPLLTAAILFVAVLFRSTFGFGDALVAMPLLTMAVGPRVAAPVVELVGVVVAAVIAWEARAALEWRAVRTLFLSALPGIPVGVLALRALPPRIIEIALASVLIGYGGWSLSRLPGRRAEPPPVSTAWALPLGFASGAFGAATSASGPPVVIYGSLRRWPPDRFRANLQGYFLALSVLVAAGHGLGGLWSVEVGRLVLVSLPGLLLAAVLGKHLNRRIPADRFHAAIYALLVALGLLTLL